MMKNIILPKRKVSSDRYYEEPMTIGFAGISTEIFPLEDIVEPALLTEPSMDMPSILDLADADEICNFCIPRIALAGKGRDDWFAYIKRDRQKIAAFGATALNIDEWYIYLEGRNKGGIPVSCRKGIYIGDRSSCFRRGGFPIEGKSGVMLPATLCPDRGSVMVGFASGNGLHYITGFEVRF